MKKEKPEQNGTNSDTQLQRKTQDKKKIVINKRKGAKMIESA